MSKKKDVNVPFSERRRVDMVVVNWTAKKKYKCPECGKVLRREGGLYKCDPCKLDVQLKMNMGMPKVTRR